MKPRERKSSPEESKPEPESGTSHPPGEVLEPLEWEALAHSASRKKGLRDVPVRHITDKSDGHGYSGL